MSTSRFKPQKQQPSVNPILNSKKAVCNIAYATLFLTSVASAGTMGPIAIASPLQGLYIGLAGGGAFTTANETNLSSVDISFPNAHGGTISISNPVFSNTITNLFKNSGIGALLIGYGFEHKRLYLGLEGFLNYSDYKMRNSGNFSSTMQFSDLNQNYVITNNWKIDTKISPFQGGLNLRPGFLVTPAVLTYGLAGFSVAKVNLSAHSTGTVVYSDDELGPQLTNTYPFELNPHARRSVTAWCLGTGVEYAFRPQWSARLEYIYTNYGNIGANSLFSQTVTSAGNIYGTGTLTVNSSVGVGSIATNTVMVGISRYFA